MTTITTLDAAMALNAQGVCVVRVRTDGSKRPVGEWQQWQRQRPPATTLLQWFTTGHEGIGVVCGHVSGGLEMFEMEGRFVERGGLARFVEAVKAAGIGDVFDRLVSGYSVASPSGGLHFHFKVSDGPALPNTKLARDGDVLMETRGEGGFVVVPPSSGTVHPSGRPWALTGTASGTIPSLTVAERDALYAVARTFDVPAATPEPVAAPQPPPRRDLPPIEGETPIDFWNRTREFRSELLRYGWTWMRDASPTESWWVRPGKAANEGQSAVLHEDGNPILVVWSSNAPAQLTQPRYERDGKWRFDCFEFVCAMEFGGDRLAMQRWVRSEFMPALPGVEYHVPTLLPPSWKPGDAAAPAPASVRLDDEFWNARPVLGHIRQAAHARYRSAEAFLGVVLARLAASVHPSIQLAPTVGAAASLSTYVAIVGPSGSGKSSTVRAVADLLPITNREVADNLPLGSGEGLMEVYYDMVSEDGPNGKPIMVKRRVRHGAFMFLDEGEALAKMGADRAGSTIMPVLRSAWTGATVGTTNAKTETKRLLEAGTYSLGFVIGFQPEIAGPLLDDHIGGTPQRFLWLSNVDPTIPREPPPWPGPLRWTHPPLMRLGDRTSARYIEAPASVVALLAEHAHAVGTGAKVPDALDSHAHLVRLKVAALLAVLDGRTAMDDEDWSLAEAVVAASDAVRGGVLEAVAAERRGKAHASRVGYAERELMVDEARHQQAVRRVARNIARFVHANGETPRAEVRRNSTRSTDRSVFEEALDEAVSKGWVVRVDDRLAPGGSQPA